MFPEVRDRLARGRIWIVTHCEPSLRHSIASIGQFTETKLNLPFRSMLPRASDQCIYPLQSVRSPDLHFPPITLPRTTDRQPAGLSLQACSTSAQTSGSMLGSPILLSSRE